MEIADVVVTLLTAILGGSMAGVIVSWYVGMKEIRFRANFERKMKRYQHIIGHIEIYLHPEQAKYAIQSVAWDFRNTSPEENRRLALEHLILNKQQLIFITHNQKVIDEFERFLNEPNEDRYDKLIKVFSKDLWK